MTMGLDVMGCHINTNFSAPVILKLLNLARNSLALNYLALCCPNA